MIFDFFVFEVGEFNFSFCLGDGEVDIFCFDVLIIFLFIFFWDLGVGEFLLIGVLKKF